MMRSIAVLGAGSWGTALAVHLARAGHAVTLWSHRAEQADELQQIRQNQRYLPNVVFPKNLQVTSDLSGLLAAVEAVLIVVPSQVFAQTLAQVVSQAPGVAYLAWATKGFEPKTKRLLHQIAEDYLPAERSFAVLSGPTFAAEVAKGLPTAMVSASFDVKQAHFWSDVFHYGAFRMYTQSDVVGVEVGGAYKNIMAIATGVSDGLHLGANARAALIARGMAEMERLGQALGAQPETFKGLAGLGDLVLTCTDDLSRNRRFGKLLAQQHLSVDQVITQIGQVVEGVKAVAVVQSLAVQYALELPIAEQVFALVNQQVTVKQAVTNLLEREQKSELTDLGLD